MAWKDKNIQIGSLLGPGTVVDGHFKTNGSARIDGEVKGNVEVESTLIIGETGKVDGDVMALSVTIGGEVLGDVDAQDRVELMEGAKVLGDITTKVLVIDENAIFQGKCNMYQDVPNKKNKNKKPIGANKKSAKAAVFAAIAELKEKEQAAEAEAANSSVGNENSQPINEHNTINEQNNSNVQNSSNEQNNALQNATAEQSSSLFQNGNSGSDQTNTENTAVEQNETSAKAEEEHASSQPSIASKLLGLLREEKNDQTTEKHEEISTFGTISDQTETTETNVNEQPAIAQEEKKEQNSSSEGNSIPGINTSLLS